MQQQHDEKLATLSVNEIAQVAGGAGPHRTGPLQVQDMYGNTLSVEAWMDRLLIPAELTESGWAHDFYSIGPDPKKPGI